MRPCPVSRVVLPAGTCRQGGRAKDAGLIVLRHESTVLRGHAGRVRYGPADRLWLAALARLIPRRDWAAIVPIAPATLLAWHRRLVAGNTTRATGARPAARRQDRASPASS